MKKLIIFSAIILYLFFMSIDSPLRAANYVSENWDTGTPAACWPCIEENCDTPFNGWECTMGYAYPGCGRSSTQKHSGSYSYHQTRQSGAPDTCDIVHDIPAPYPTKIYLRFYLLLTNSWDNIITNNANWVTHFLFLNSARSNTGINLSIVGRGYWTPGCSPPSAPSPFINFGPEVEGNTWWNGTWNICEHNLIDDIGRWVSHEFMFEIYSGNKIRITYWRDGVQVNTDTSDAEGRGGVSATDLYRLILSGWENTSSAVSTDFYIDDIVVSDSYIGLTEASPDTTPPSPPANVVVS